MADPYKDSPAGPAAKKALERLESCFGKDGKSLMPCDNKCGTQIGITSFHYFMLPEHKNYQVLFVCLRCVQQLVIQYDYKNKN